MKCMYCKKEIVEKLSFNNVFSKKDSLVLCEECKYNIDINITELAEYTLYYFGDYEFLKETIYNIKYSGAIHKAERFRELFSLFFKKYKFNQSNYYRDGNWNSSWNHSAAIHSIWNAWNSFCECLKSYCTITSILHCNECTRSA